MALNSQLDKDGKVDKSKNGAQFKDLNPPIKGGDLGSRSSTSKDMKEKNTGKLFAGGS